MSNADMWQHQWLVAVRDGAREPSAERIKELHEKAAEAVQAKRAYVYGDPVAAMITDREFERRRDTRVPYDYIAVRAEEFLGLEAAHAHAMAEMLTVAARYHELGKMFANARAKAMPTGDGELLEIETTALRTSGRLGEALISLVRELRAYRSVGT